MSGRLILIGAMTIPLLFLAGCYRSASDDGALQNFDNPTSAPQIRATNTMPPIIVPSMTNTAPPVTRVIPSAATNTPQTATTATSAPLRPVTNTPLATPFVPITQTATRAPLVPATSTPITPSLPATASPTPQVITPSGPSFPVPIDTPTPIPAQPTTTEAAPLITPTQILIDAANAPDECTYTVRAGDNLFRIALNNNVTLEALRAANPQVQGDIIQPGDILLLPDCDPNAVATTPTAAADSSPAESSGGIIHIVQPGETLLQIAQRYGTTVEALVEANNLSNPNNLTVNQELVIP